MDKSRIKIYLRYSRQVSRSTSKESSRRESVVVATVNMVQEDGATSSDYQYNVYIEDDDG